VIKNSIFLVFCIFVLFEVKYSSISIESNIAESRALIVRLDDEYKLLKADWKFLTSPSRVQKLSDVYLELRETEPFQIKTVDSYREKTIHIVNKKKTIKF